MSHDEEEFALKREAMVALQIEADGIKDGRLLGVMRKIKRHLFVPFEYRQVAYADHPVPIGYGQTISQPYIVALMTELLALKGNEKVLEIGSGSGYQAAILAELAKEVYSLEVLEPLSIASQKLLEELGYRNIHIKTANGFLGWKDAAPFDAIIATCAPEEIPQALVEQLAEGGRMVIPVGGVSQELQLIQKANNQINIRSIIPVRFVPMVKNQKE